MTDRASLAAGLRFPSDELAARYRADGWWNDDTFGRFVERQATAHPDVRARTFSQLRPATSTIGELHARAARIAGGLAARGIGAGDVVAYQLPNWIDTLAILWAGFRLGAVMVPIVHFYGPREVEFILEQSGARAIVTCTSFGQLRPLANLATIREGLDALETVVVVENDDEPWDIRGGLTLADLEAGPVAPLAEVSPDSPAMIGYTSGTTADPKGVIHTHRTLLAEVRQVATSVPRREATLATSPLAHMTGMMGGSLLPLHNGLPIELIDRWDTDQVLTIIREHGIAPGGGATIFLTGLLDHPDFGPADIAVLSKFGLGGSPVPAAIAERAERAGISITRVYGSTEHPSITGSNFDDDVASRTRTDGAPMPGVEIKLLDDDGNEVPAGSPGEIYSRGPDLFVGYTDPALTAKAFDGSWYRTGDVGILDARGYLTITDRVSDLIIRGGYNISAAEIEELLVAMPGVAEVAVVAAPDPRLGERACAVLRLAPGASEPDLDAVQAHLGAHGLPRQKYPEDVRVVADFARTPSGKIKKRELREWLRASDA